VRRRDGLRHCHGYVADDWADKLRPPGPQEREMISAASMSGPTAASLPDQATEELDGLVIAVPDSQT